MHYEDFWKNTINSAPLARSKARSLIIVHNAIHVTYEDDVPVNLVKYQRRNMFLLVITGLCVPGCGCPVTPGVTTLLTSVHGHSSVHMI